MIYTFDDGSTISNDETPTGWTSSSTPAADSGVAGWSADQREADKLGQFYPTGNGEWWQKAAAYGVTRAVDAHFGRPPVNKTSDPATFAGQNGKTYTTASAAQGGGNSNLLLLALAGAAFFAFS